MMLNLIKVLLFFPVLLLVACVGGNHYAPLVDRMTSVSQPPNTHVVRRGETLFSIAWRYGVDVRRLAATNNIVSPYTIYPNQQLNLKLNSAVSKTSSSRSNSTASNSAVKLVRPSKVPVVPSQKASSKTKTSTPTANVAANTSSQWLWPVKGKVISAYSFSSATHKGIDLQGVLGEPVHASKGGGVVYAGSGLVGYGNLLIIKHDEHYLSAYGHNSKLLVKEGDVVKAGQKIAEIGDTGTNKMKLHFEIRRDGKPIDPLKLLKH
jgi:lipoprotein NlpD